MVILIQKDRINEGEAQVLARVRSICPQAETHIVSFDEVPDALWASAEIIFGGPDPARLKEAKSLLWLHKDAAGVHDVNDPALYAHPDKILLTNSSGLFGQPIAEHVLMMLLATYHRLPEMLENQKKHLWKGLRDLENLIGKHAVIVGLGDLGGEVAWRLHALGVRVTGVRRNPEGEPVPGVDTVIATADVDTVLPKADILVCALPVTPQTVGFLSKERIALLGDHCVVVNIGRGVHVDTQALMDALHAGRIGGACLDVTDPEPLPADHPLWDCPNTIITPHCSALTVDRIEKIYCLFLENLALYAKGEPLLNRVDFTSGY